MATRRHFRWKLNPALAVGALFLGAVAVIGNPYPGETANVRADELAAMIESEVDHVTPQELADWIIQGTTDYRLIDLRSADEYSEYRIPSAENVSITGLSDYPIERNERIVLYSADGVHAAQAWIILKARQYPGASTLLGGLDAWKEEILFPRAPLEATPESTARFERAVHVSQFFGGQPRAAESSTQGSAAWEPAELELPEVAAPAPVAPGTPRKKKKKEGC